MKTNGDQWHKAIWKIVTNPATEVILAILVVIVATWFVVSTEAVQRGPHIPYVDQ